MRFRGEELRGEYVGFTDRPAFSDARAIADELNARGLLTRRGGRWHKSTVINLLDRLGWISRAALA